MLNIFLGAPIVGILIALSAVVIEQLLAVGANIIFQKEIVLDVYTHLSFFLIAAAIIEESLKYFSAIYVLRQNFSLKRFRFVFAAAISGLFFGLTEVCFILLANGKKFRDIGTLDKETNFSLLAVILVHTLTMLFIAALVASRKDKVRLAALRTIIPPALIHLLLNFLIIQKGDFTNWLIGITLGITFVTILSIIVFNIRELD